MSSLMAPDRCPECDNIAEKTHCESAKPPRKNRHCPWWICGMCGHWWKRPAGYSGVGR